MTTIKDIASDTGFSVSTVSAVLRGKGEELGIKRTTREKVESSARELGYLRNEIARNMVKGRSNVIAYLDRNIGWSEYVGRIVSSIMREAGSRNHYVKLFACDRANPLDNLNSVLGQRPAAIIFRGVLGEAYERLLTACESLRIPVCSLTNPGDNQRGWFVHSLDSEGFHSLVSHLYELGHRRIANLTMKPKGEGENFRQKAFLDTVKFLKLNLPDHFILEYDNSGKLEGTIEELLNYPENERPTAICCGSDFMAMDVIRVATRMGLKLPEDLSITGFADLTVARYACPRLTSARQRYEEIGETAARMVLDILEKDDFSGWTRVVEKPIPVDLIQRESTMVRTRR